MALRLLRIARIDVYAHWSLLIVFALVVASLARGVFPAWHPDWSESLAWTTALAAAGAFFACLLAHELAHALVGRRYGAVIPRITLFVLGGVAQVEREAPHWRGELWMAAAGPLASLVLGALCFLGAERFVEPAAPDGPSSVIAQLGPLASLLLWLAQANILLALFNLVPGFPLDGGRMLRALLWAATGDVRGATRCAAALGRAFAGLLFGTGIAMLLEVRVPLLGSGLAGLWLMLLGGFLYTAARVHGRPPASRSRHASPRISVQALLDTRMMAGGRRAVAVVEGERLVGRVSLADAMRVAPGARAHTPLGKIMTPP